MKKLLLLLPISIMFSCESKKDVENELKLLKNERIELRENVNQLDLLKGKKQEELYILESKLKELKIYEKGKSPKYILKLKLKQSRFSLDIGEHIKDEMNSIEFEMPVDKDFYTNIKVGTEIVDDFRMGSFVLKGSFSSWEMKVIGKYITE